MSKQIAWMPMVIALYLVGLGRASADSAREGFSAFSGMTIHTSHPMSFVEPMLHQRSVSHHPGNVIHHNHVRSEGILPALIWPYDPYSGAYSPAIAATGTEPPSEPQIIVMPSNPQPQGTTVQESRLDFSYVGGCHAIPNGYHCDTADAHKEP